MLDRCYNILYTIGMITNDLKTFMETKHITQEAMAGKLGVSFVTINRWLTGKNKPSQLAYLRIEELLRKK